MSQKNIPATRQELMRFRNKKKTAQRGHKLLKDKRDSLMQTFVALIRETIRMRRELDVQYLRIIEEFRLAKMLMDDEYVDVLAETPSTTINLQKTIKSIMGVKVPELSVDVEGNFLNYGFLQTNVHLDNALQLLRDLLPNLLALLEKEHAASLLAAEIEKTRRRVNALEYVIIPEVDATIKDIRSKLDEQAREATVSLIKMKQKMAS